MTTIPSVVSKKFDTRFSNTICPKEATHHTHPSIHEVSEGSLGYTSGLRTFDGKLICLECNETIDKETYRWSKAELP
jgi:hypothetical protein